MGLLTLQTRLMTVLKSAQELKIDALNYVNILNNPVQIGKLFKISKSFSYLITTICTPYESDTDLADYADLQFATTFNLSTKIITIKDYLQDAIDEINSIVSPYTQSDWFSDTTVTQNGEIITVNDYSTGDTSDLKTIMQAIYDNIPE